MGGVYGPLLFFGQPHRKEKPSQNKNIIKKGGKVREKCGQFRLRSGLNQSINTKVSQKGSMIKNILLSDGLGRMGDEK